MTEWLGRGLKIRRIRVQVPVYSLLPPQTKLSMIVKNVAPAALNPNG